MAASPSELSPLLRDFFVFWRCFDFGRSCCSVRLGCAIALSSSHGTGADRPQACNLEPHCMHVQL